MEPLVYLIGQANAMLSRYDGLLENLINPQVLLSPLVMKEAELSSRIEGTMATANEAYQKEAGREFTAEKEADIQEVLNYRSTLQLATHLIGSRPINLYLIRQMHSTLMQGVRGAQLQVGGFRVTQNWISPTGCSIDEATYVPPSPEQLPGHLEQFEAVLTSAEREPDPIVRAALLHAQFELIHPFDDGNGRIGRLLIPLYLSKIGCLVKPSFYISGYFETHRAEYLQRLGAISSHGDWMGWIEFFLKAVVEQAQQNIGLVRSIGQLYEQKKNEFLTLLKTELAVPLLDYLFKKPVFYAPDVHRTLGINRVRAAKYIGILREAGIFQEIEPATGRQGAFLALDALFEITDQQ
ncbi:MAG: Fic family protein [Gammaproteobacteria bacterium]|nr:Fic family protein [Gammaproteobacteria bacterium]